MGVEFWAVLAGVGEVWEAVRLRGDVGCVWQVLEATLATFGVPAASGYHPAGGRGAGAGPFCVAVAASDPPAVYLEELAFKRRAEEDQLRAEGREARRAGWRQ